MTHIPHLTPQEFMECYRLLIVDADGTVRRCTVPNQPCLNKSDEWVLIPEAVNWLQQVDWNRYCIGVASNQGGIELGYLSLNDAYQMLCDMVTGAIQRWPPIGTLQICPHMDKAHPDRKPNPGMLFKIMQKWQCATWQTLVVGDLESDKQAAEAAGCDFVWAWDLFGFEREEASTS